MPCKSAAERPARRSRGVPRPWSAFRMPAAGTGSLRFTLQFGHVFGAQKMQPLRVYIITAARWRTDSYRYYRVRYRYSGIWVKQILQGSAGQGPGKDPCASWHICYNRGARARQLALSLHALLPYVTRHAEQHCQQYSCASPGSLLLTRSGCTWPEWRTTMRIVIHRLVGLA